MRKSIAFLSCLTILGTTLITGTASAYTTDDPINNPDNLRNISTGSLPIEGYRSGDTYIINPVEMTNTRDNRGSIIPSNNCAHNDHHDGAWNGQHSDGQYRTMNQ